MAPRAFSEVWDDEPKPRVGFQYLQTVGERLVAFLERQMFENVTGIEVVDGVLADRQSPSDVAVADIRRKPEFLLSVKLPSIRTART